jgi:Phasin protein
MQPQEQFLELYRASLRSATDMMNASLQQTEHLQQQQLEIMRGALEDTERQIADAKSIDDIVALNSRITGTQLERLTEFWGSMWRAAAESQKVMVDQMQAQLGHVTERVRQGFEFTARTSEDAARLAAKQMTQTTEQLRGAIVEQERRAQAARQAHERKAAR